MMALPADPVELRGYTPTVRTLEAVYEDEARRLREEVEFLRQALLLALAHNTGKSPRDE